MSSGFDVPTNIGSWDSATENFTIANDGVLVLAETISTENLRNKPGTLDLAGKTLTLTTKVGITEPYQLKVNGSVDTTITGAEVPLDGGLTSEITPYQTFPGTGTYGNISDQTIISCDDWLQFTTITSTGNKPGNLIIYTDYPPSISFINTTGVLNIDNVNIKFVGPVANIPLIKAAGKVTIGEITGSIISADILSNSSLIVGQEVDIDKKSVISVDTLNKSKIIDGATTTIRNSSIKADTLTNGSYVIKSSASTAIQPDSTISAGNLNSSCVIDSTIETSVTGSTIKADTLTNGSYIFGYTDTPTTTTSLDITQSSLNVGTINNSYITSKHTEVNINGSTIDIDTINWVTTNSDTDESIIKAETITIDTNNKTDLPPPVVVQSTMNIGSCLNTGSGTLIIMNATGPNTLVLQNIVKNLGNFVKTTVYQSAGDIIIKEVNILVNTLANNSILFDSAKNITMTNELVNINSIYNSIGIHATGTFTMKGGSYIIDKFGDVSKAIKAGVVNITEFSDILITYARMKFLCQYTIGILTTHLSVDCPSSIVIKNIPFCTTFFISIAILNNIATLPTLEYITNAIYLEDQVLLENRGYINISSSRCNACIQFNGIVDNTGEIDINCNCIPNFNKEANTPIYCCYTLPKLCGTNLNNTNIVSSNHCDPCNNYTCNSTSNIANVPSNNNIVYSNVPDNNNIIYSNVPAPPQQFTRNMSIEPIVYIPKNPAFPYSS